MLAGNLRLGVAPDHELLTNSLLILTTNRDRLPLVP